MDGERIDPTLSEELLRICRTAVGDELRSVTYFTESEIEQLYLRSDLTPTADLVGFAEIERTGFRADELYAGTELGKHRMTIRSFEHGYLTRVISEDHGVWLTTDSMSIDRFEELSEAIETTLETR